MSEVYFGSVKFQELGNVQETLPVKMQKILRKMKVDEMVEDKSVAVKMHLGKNFGYSTIHPLFVKLLVDEINKGNPEQVFVTDLNFDVAEASNRGYTQEVLGAPLYPVAGIFDKYFYSEEIGFKKLNEVEIAGLIHDVDVIINLSHVKGHGCCAYGGACKNIAMGCVTGSTRGQIHSLEGGIKWDEEKCTYCKKCLQECRYDANSFEDGKYKINFHNCTYCQHCVKMCPEEALQLTEDNFDDFQEGMAITTKTVLDTFDKENILHINVMTDITYLCDCWGQTTPSLVPDIGIAASKDMVAIEKACLDMIDEEDLLPNSLPEGYELTEGNHLFEKIHGRDPYIQVEYLEQKGLGTQDYNIKEIK